MAKIIHVGLPKAASSSLQTYFRGIGDIPYLGKFGRTALYVDPDIKNIYWDHVSRYRENAPATSELAMRFVEALATHNIPPDHYIISDEILSGIGFGWFRRSPRRLTAILERLAGINGADAHFLLVLRQQTGLLKSYYAQLLRRGYPLTFETFLRRQGTEHPDSLHEGLAYGSILEFCHSRNIRLHTLFFEEIIDNASTLVNFLSTLGVQAPLNLPAMNPTVQPKRALEILTNTRTGRRPMRASVFSMAETEVDEDAFKCAQQNGVFWAPEDVLARVSDLFRDENRKVRELTGKDPGYPV